MLMHVQDDPDADPELYDLQVLITAEEVYPEMERAFLAAKREIWASYRVFDLSTKLRSAEGQAVGETWFDLIVEVLKRGVALHMVLSDFDPILAPKLHCASWKSRRAFVAAGEVVGPSAKLEVTNAVHAARVGLLPRIALWPRMMKELSRHARDLNGQSAQVRAKRLECSPGLRTWLTEKPGGTLRPRRWPAPPLIPGTHHQKIAVFDRSLLCVGGLDLDERRYDDKGHHRRRDETWHDVQLMCRGTVADDAQAFLEAFLLNVDGQAPPKPNGRLLRTLSRRRDFEAPHLGPRPQVSELAEAHHRMVGSAQQLIYLETQFFRDRRLADALAEAGARNKDLGLIMVLPGAPEDVAFEGSTSSDARFGEYLQVKCVDSVQEAFGDRVAFCSPVRPERMTGTGRDTLCGAPIIYVHAKVSIFDDAQALVSSANLNGRSLYWDTEAGVALRQTKQVHALRRRVFRHWLFADAADTYYDLATAPGAWRKLAARNAEKAPDKRDGFLVPYDPVPARAFGRPLPGVPPQMV
ncbi:MAG: phospholipase D-like domain-containing protein [Pseudomonadota bacterium]